MKIINKTFTILVMLTLLITGSIDIKASGFTIATNKTQVSAGESFTVSVQGNIAGRFDATVSNGTLNTSSIFVDSPGSGGSFTITPNGAGDIYVTVTATDVSEGGTYEPVTGSQGVNVRFIVANANPNPPTNNTSQNKPITPEIKDDNKDVMPINEDTESLVQPRNVLPIVGIDAISIKHKNDTVLVASSLGEFKTIKGFTTQKVNLNKAIDKVKELEVLKHKENGFLLVRGFNEKTKEENLYLFDNKNDSLIDVLQKININNKDYHFINALDNKKYIKNEITKNIFKIKKNEKIEENNIDVLKFKDKDKNNYSVLYVMDNSGVFKYIQYESSSNTFQPYAMQTLNSSCNKIESTVGKNDSVIDIVLIVTISIISIINIVLLYLNLSRRKRGKTSNSDCDTLADINEDDEFIERVEEEIESDSNSNNLILKETVLMDANDEYIQSTSIDTEAVVLEFIKMQTPEDLEKSEQLLEAVMHPSENADNKELDVKFNEFVKLNIKILYLVSNQLKVTKYPNIEINKIISAGKRGYIEAMREINPVDKVTQDTLFEFRKNAVNKIICYVDDYVNKNN